MRTARDVVFDEGRGWAWNKAVDDGSAPTYDDFTVEYAYPGWGSRQLFFAERAYPGPRASTDSGARHTGGTTLFSCDSGCAEFLGCTTTAGDAAHSSTDSHSSGHAYSSTCSQPGGVRYSALSRRGAHRRVPRR